MSTKTILVLDPDRAIAGLLRFILEDQGYKVFHAASLKESGKLLSNAGFDLVITEALNQTDRFDFDPTFIAELRLRAGDTPILLLSYYASTDYLRAGDFGLAEVISKPFDVDVLLQKVRGVVSKAEPK